MKSSSDVGIEPDAPVFENIRILEVDNVPVTAKDVAKYSLRDRVLIKVIKCVKNNSWLEMEKEKEVKAYLIRRHELSVDEGCLLWGCRVVVPKDLRGKMLQTLHDCHPGINRMKALSRSYFWWPGMDTDIENLVKSCHSCQLNQNNTAKAPIHPWEWTNKPWVRIHVDYAGPFLNKMFLVIIDSHSKWLDVIPTANASSKETIKILRSVFATLPYNQ